MNTLQDTPAWLASHRLRLREWAWHDVDHIARMHQDQRVRAQLVDDHPLHTFDAAHRFVAGMRAFYRQHEGTGIWCAERALPPDAESVAEACAAHAAGEIGDALLAAVQAPDWQFCGWFSLVHLADAPDALEIGARLMPDAWGGTLALDGGEWLLARAFEALGREQVWGYCAPGNRSAAHCLRVLGFSFAGLARYNGQQAARFTLARSHWRCWRTQPRRVRQRQVLASEAGL